MSWIGDIIGSVRDIIVGSRKPKPARFNNPHMWRSYRKTQLGSNPARLEILDTPVCDYCKQEQTTANHFAPCPGPAIEAR